VNGVLWGMAMAEAEAEAETGEIWQICGRDGGGAYILGGSS
jgi:hypothetical protein